MHSPPVSRPSGRSRRGRIVALLATPVLAALVLPVSASPSANSAPPQPAPDQINSTGESDPATFSPLADEIDGTQVTLITGDVVTYREQEGEPTVSVEAAPREDDHPVTFVTKGDADAFYVYPSDVEGYVHEGRLDRELFNVAGLVRQGLDDASTGGELPLIVTFDHDRSPAQLKRDADALPAADDAEPLETVNGAAVTVDRGQAGRFRAAVMSEPEQGARVNSSQGLGGVVEKVWLDSVLEIDLDESVPQIGAPAAWDAGYTGEGVTVAVLDTGVDASHPDLAGQVVAAENFAGDGEPVDDHGHGTHVASTIAGTGAASGGQYTGVAPDADLLSGKVCNAAGDCQESAIIAAMEWATSQGADIVNMSLGGDPTDGTDPLSQTLNQLSADTDTLFVVSAGNNGLRFSVGSPGSADAALTVAAVDKTDRRAGFSSRGPRVGDFAVKPNITAPGVDIAAARATGTAMGNPVDDHYTAASGTSMAAPHVAGAAALLAQAKPELSGSALKDALASTATNGSLGGTITSGPYEGTTFTMTFGSDTPPIDTAVSGTPTFVGAGCDPLEAGEGIALVERGPSTGPCTFQEKLDHITAAGYETGIVFNQPGAGCLQQTVMEASGDIPFIFVSRLVGLQLLQQPDLTTANACATESLEPGSQVASTTIGRGAGPGHLWSEQGTGRVDVPAALVHDVYAPASVDFGSLTDQSAQKQVVYTNHGDTSITLHLTASLQTFFGDPADGLTLAADTVTVPADGQASVAATVDPEVAGRGVFGGVITATDADADVALRTAVGFGSSAGDHTVTIRVLDSQGNPYSQPSTGGPPITGGSTRQIHLTHDTFDIRTGVGQQNYTFRVDDDGVATGRVPTGTYTIIESNWEADPATGEPTRQNLLVQVETRIDSDTTITLDARTATRLDASVPRDVEVRSHTWALFRQFLHNGGLGLISAPSVVPVYVTPAPAGELWRTTFFTHWTLAEPQPVSPATIHIRGDVLYSEAPSYIYNLPFLYENGIPDTLHHKVAHQDLVEWPARYHADDPDAIVEHQFDAWPPPAASTSFFPNRIFIRPGRVIEYFLADDRFTWIRNASLFSRADVESPGNHWLLSFDRFLNSQAGTRRDEDRWFEAPLRTGAADIRDEAVNNPIGLEAIAAFIRGGPDGNLFQPGTHAMDNTRGHWRWRSGRQGFGIWRMWNLDAGKELEPVGAIPEFALAPGAARYRLEKTWRYPALVGGLFHTKSASTTVWEFQSETSASEISPGYECGAILGGHSCEFQPIIQLAYAANLDIHNQAPAGRAHLVSIEAGSHSKTPDHSPVTDIAVEYSTDGGGTWTDARTVGKIKAGTARVVIKHPPLSRTDGFVSLRVKAEDADGNTVDQTTIHAYALYGSKSRGSRNHAR